MGETNHPHQPYPPTDFHRPAPENHKGLPNNRGIVMRLPRAVAVFVTALLIIGLAWLGFRVGGNVSGVSPHYFFGGLLSFFAAMLAVISVVAVRKKRAVSHWIPAVGTIVESQAVWGRGSKGGRTWLPRITYRYGAGARFYQGNRIAFYRHCTGYGAQELIARHPVGSQVPVYYDPAKPAEAVMDRSFRAVWLLPLFAVVCAALAVVFFKLPTMLAR